MIFYVVASLLAGGDLFIWWWGDRRLRGLKLAGWWRGLYSLLVGSQFITLAWWLLFPISLQVFGEAFWKPVTAWLYMWHLLVLPTTLVFVLLGSLGWGVGRLVAWVVRPRVASAGYEDAVLFEESPAVPLSSRRRFLAATAAFAPQVVLGAALLESARQIGRFRIRPMELLMPGLPKGLDGMVIAHVSDTHVGRFVGPREFDVIVEATAGLKPDLIAFTGDLIDHNLVDLPPAIAAMKRMREVAPVAMCVGNHDLFDDGLRFRSRVRQAELGLVVDEAMPLVIRGELVDVLGLDWGVPGAPRADGIDEHMDAILNRRRSDAFSILLAHHPHAFDPAAAAGIPLTLSGHTHGGQIMVTDTIGAGRMYRYWSGLYEKGASKLVVSNGVGNWFPLRINAPAEIVKITLRQA